MKPEFSYRLTASGVLLVRWGGREVRRLAGSRAKALAVQLATATPAEAQQLLARATGNFKRGNERQAAGR
ncbi:MAG TPA: hypothetical protein VJT14_12165 [Candidatus Dormibacteraeota bacterium]|nr:hypothetical protein [Candidatus Dormibacteraeota bacterium]